MALRDLFRRKVEKRWVDDAEPSWGALGAAAGQYPYSIGGAECLTAVASSINFISAIVASLPPLLYSVSADGRRVENTTHPVNRALMQPNVTQTWPEFSEWMLASVLHHGNAVALLDHDMAGRLISLTPVPWGMVNVQIGASSGAPVFDISWPGRPQVRYLAAEVLHLKDRGANVYIGQSRLHRAAQTVHHAHAADTAALSSFNRSARPSGMFKISGVLARSGHDNLRARIEENVAGAARAGKILLLQEGLDYVPIDASTARDAELLASRQWGVVDIARLFGIPPVLIGDWSNISGQLASQAMVIFATTTLTAWVRKFEAAFNAAVFGASTGARFELALDMSGLQRADPQVRVAADNVLLSHAVISKNECRESWGYSPSSAPGMDEFNMPAPQTGGAQLTGTQPGNMPGAPGGMMQ